jgi:Bacterial Ig-like domain
MDTKTVTSVMESGWRFEAIGDFDGDRAEDILWRHSSTKELVVWLLDPETATIKTGSGYIKQTATQNYMIPDSFRVAGVGDTNGDGKGDIIWRNELASNVVIWQMDGNQLKPGVGGVVGTYNPERTILTPIPVDAGWELVDTARINDDAKFDLVWRNRTSNQVVNWIMDGNVLTSGGTTTQLLGAAYDIESVGDFNGDGRGDLLWRDTQGNVQMWLVNSQYNNYDIQTLKLQATGAFIPAVGTEWKLVGVEDFSGDGKGDIVWRYQTPGTQTSGAIVLWTMDGATVTQQSTSVSNADVTNLNRQTLGTASKADFVDFGVQLAAATDSGVSQNDWITNVRRSELSGVAAAGSQVNLFANNVLIGTTTATTAGTWSIVGSELDDGVYTLSTQITSKAGFVMNQSIGRKLTIDGTAADMQITGVKDGIAWDKQINLAGILRDMDPNAKVEWSVSQNGTLQVSAVLGATLENPTATGAMIRQQALTATPITLGDATSTEVSKPYEITLKATDRAGNISTQIFKGMRLNLPELTEESFLLPGSAALDYQPDDRIVSPTNMLNNPTAGGGYLFIGTGGSWGYSSGTGGTGSVNWTAVSNPVTAVPGNATNLDSKVNYLAGLRLALTTAQKALSNHPTIAMKKQSLSEQLEMVMAVGEVVEQNNLFQSMTPMLQGIFGKVYTAGGITKRQAIERGWQFAKDLAISTKMTGLQIFQANLYAVGLIALKQNNVTNSTGLQGAIEALSTTYARLRPTPNGNPLDYFYGNKLYNHNDFLSIAWSSSPVNSRYYKPTERVTSLGTGSVQDAERQDLVTAIADLTDHLRGQANPMKALQMLDRTFQAATQVTNLHQDSYSFEGSTGVYYSTSLFQRQSSIHDTGVSKGCGSTVVWRHGKREINHQSADSPKRVATTVDD